ncbi:MAG TPA: Bax inhibitor-1/YccA family protein [Gammaproteobacteria bacterium]|nr:Bax inhibitor-1/YccA family protein [Gammaproteobacteria bacterium]
MNSINPIRSSAQNASQAHAAGQRVATGVETSRVLRNTYALLSMTLLFSAATAGGAMALNLPHPGLLLTLAGYFGLLFVTAKFRNSALGIVSVFALTGFMGYTLGPILNSYLAMANGGQIVMNAMAGTGVIFLGLSAYVLTTRKDFSFIGGFLFAGILVAFMAGIGALVFEVPALSLAVSAMFVLLMAGLILYETSNIIHGGESNYIMATVSLYVAIFNLFTSLLHLLGFMSGEE